MKVPTILSNKKFYYTNEALGKIGISRSTFFKWLREQKIEDTKQRNRNGWRLFTENDIKKIIKYKDTIITN